MRGDIRKSILRILHPEDSSTLGTGFLIHESGLILTAAHVIAGPALEDRDRLPEEIWVEFLVERIDTQKKPEPVRARILKDYFRPFRAGDIAVLKCETVPDAAVPLRLGSALNETGRDSVKTFGFPGSKESGEHGTGELLGELLDESMGFQVLQLSSDNITNGFSGAPVINMVTSNVIGMVSWLEARNMAFVIPAQEINLVGQWHDPVWSQVFTPESQEGPRRSKAYQMPRFADLKNDSTFLAEIKRETVGFLSSNPTYTSSEGRLNLLTALDLGVALRHINNHFGPDEAWFQVVSYLQFSKIDYIVQIIQSCTINLQRKPVADRLVEQWLLVAKKPYFYAFEGYLNRLVRENKYLDLSKKYVELFGEVSEEIRAIDPIAVEQKEFEALSPEAYWEREQKADPADETKTPPKAAEEGPRIDSILNIAKDEDRFILIGRPGSGKTATLRKILFKNAQSVLDGDPLYKIPIFITANQVNAQNSIYSLICEDLPEWQNPELDRSRFLLLIDGINEINPNFQRNARREMKVMLQEYEGTSFIISSRKYGYQHDYDDLLLFELKELQPYQIRQFVHAYKPNCATEIWEALRDVKNYHLWLMASNPLMLFMMVLSYDEKKERILPANRGGLYRKFINIILASDDKRALHQSNVSLKIKEKLLSELAFQMRQNDFNLPLKEVEAQFTRRLDGRYETAVNLINDLCNSHIIKITQQGEGRVQQFQTPETAADISTVSFVHETYLEYFCALEIKYYYLSYGKLDIEFTATEWFETIQLASDLFDSERSICDFLRYLFYGGRERLITFNQPRGAYIKGKKRLVGTINFPETIDENYFIRYDIACKLAFNVREQYSSAYQMVESLLYHEFKLWMQYADILDRDETRDNYEPYPVQYLIAAASGLSSPFLFALLFKNLFWQGAWLIPLEHEANETTKRVDALIKNLSDFNLLYTFLIEGGYTFYLGQGTLDYIREVLQQRMPFHLQKKLFESKPDLELLERLGKQDPEYYIENFQKTSGSTADFVRYLISFSANSMVQDELLKILYSDRGDPEIRNQILVSLVSKFYCVNKILDYLDQKGDEILDNAYLYPIIKNFVFSLPIEILPSRLLDRILRRSQIKAEDLPHMTTYQPGNLFVAYQGHRARLLQLKTAWINTDPYSLTVFYDFEDKYFPPDGFFTLPNGDRVEYTFVETKGRLVQLKILDKALFAQITVQSILTTDSNTGYQVANIMKKYQISVFRAPVSGTLCLANRRFPFSKKLNPFPSPGKNSGYLNIDIHNEQEESLIYDCLGSPAEIDGVKLTELRFLSANPKTLEALSADPQGFNPEEYLLSPLGEIPPALFTPEIVDQIFPHIQLKKVQSALKKASIMHLFHQHLPDVEYGIVIKVYPTLNKVLIYSVRSKRPVTRFLYRGFIEQLTQDQVVILENHFRVYPVDLPDHDEKYGFTLSHIETIQDDYMHVFNSEGKDYFLHQSTLDFIPQQFDVVSFFPSVNISKRYQGFPLARRVMKVGKGSPSLHELAHLSTEKILHKLKKEVEVDKINGRAQFRLCRLLLKEKQYYECKQYCQMLLNIEPGNFEAVILLGDACAGLADWRGAVNHYRRALQAKAYDSYFIAKIARAYFQLGELDAAENFCAQYFRLHKYSESNLHLLKFHIELLLQLEYHRLEYVMINIPPELEPHLATYFSDFAALLAKRPKNHYKALEYFEKSLEIEKMPRTCLLYSVFLYQIGDLERAEQYLKVAMNAPGDQEYQLLQFHKMTGEVEKIQFLSGTLRPENMAQKIREAIKLARSGNYVYAYKLLDTLRKTAATNPELYKALHILKVEINLKESSLNIHSVYRAAIRRKSSAREMLVFEYAHLLFKMASFEEVITLLSDWTSHGNASLHPEFHNLMGNALKEAGLLQIKAGHNGLDFHRRAKEKYRLAFEISENDILKAKYLHNMILLDLHFMEAGMSIRQKPGALQKMLDDVCRLHPGFKWTPITARKIREWGSH